MPADAPQKKSYLDAWSAVFAVLARYRPGNLVSTHRAVAEARRHIPRACVITDDELVDLIVKAAIANQMLIRFDHKQPVTSGRASPEIGLGQTTQMKSPPPGAAAGSAVAGFGEGE